MAEATVFARDQADVGRDREVGSGRAHFVKKLMIYFVVCAFCIEMNL